MSVSMQPLVHDWCREKFAQHQGHANGQRASSMLAISIFWKYQAEDCTFRRSLMPHIKASLRHGVQKDIGLDVAMADEWSRLV